MSLTMRFGTGAPRYGAPLDTRIRAAVRHCIADEIERLVNMLDVLSIDADEEPELGWAGYGPARNDATDDREVDAGDGAEMCNEQEPSLGWTDTVDQRFSVSRFGRLTVWGEDEQ